MLKIFDMSGFKCYFSPHWFCPAMDKGCWCENRKFRHPFAIATIHSRHSKKLLSPISSGGLQWEQRVRLPESTTEQTRWLQLKELLGINLTRLLEFLQEWSDSPKQQFSHLWALGDWKTKPIIRMLKFTRKGVKLPWKRDQRVWNTTTVQAPIIHTAWNTEQKWVL